MFSTGCVFYPNATNNKPKASWWPCLKSPGWRRHTGAVSVCAQAMADNKWVDALQPGIRLSRGRQTPQRASTPLFSRTPELTKRPRRMIFQRGLFDYQPLRYWLHQVLDDFHHDDRCRPCKVTQNVWHGGPATITFAGTRTLPGLGHRAPSFGVSGGTCASVSLLEPRGRI